VPPKYNDGDFVRWVQRMVDAGWRFWLWAEQGIMWQHADEHRARLNTGESHRYFRLFCDTGYIPDPYAVMPKEVQP